MSEVVSTPTGGSNDRTVKTGMVNANTAHLDWDPSLCLAQIDPIDRSLMTGTTHHSYRGNWFAEGRAMNVGFHTVLPPNSPSCAGETGDQDNAWGVFSAASEHPGGVNVLMADGSVQFVSETINTGTLSTAMPKDASTKSPYGVWGALGTPQAGEPNASL